MIQRKGERRSGSDRRNTMKRTVERRKGERRKPEDSLRSFVSSIRQSIERETFRVRLNKV